MSFQSMVFDPAVILSVGGEAAGVEGSRAALAGGVSGAAGVPSVAAAEPPRAFAPHEAEVAGRALYANGEEETLV